MDHTEVLNKLIALYGYSTYLEIGVQNPRNNFDKIIAVTKIGVDPVPFNRAGFVGTSDDFFASFFSLDQSSGLPFKYDLIFIDGLHHADQVQRDFDNSLIHLQDGGMIVLHDTLPESEHLTNVPRDKRGRWLGDVYKFVLRLNTYNEIDFYTLPFDNGITVVWRGITNELLRTKAESLNEITWNTYIENKDLMRCVTALAALSYKKI